MLEQSNAVVALTNTANLAFAQELTTLPLINVDEIEDTPAANPGVSFHPERMVAMITLQDQPASRRVSCERMAACCMTS